MLCLVSRLIRDIYTTQIQRESYYWSNYASGLIDVAANVAAIYGNSLFFSQASVPQAYYCTTGGVGNGCNAEAASIPNATVITALAYTSLGTGLSGLVAGADNGLWVESGSLGSPNNAWTPVTVGGTPIINQIIAITSDSSGDLYIVDNAGNFYSLLANQGNQATQYTMWGEIPGVVAITVDNPSMTDGSGSLYASTSSGQIYQCPLSAGSSCSSLGAATGFSSVNSLNVVTSLTASN